ncbi:MAG: endonuclease/exonuclease/phosphatase family protein [Verrucomicrobia bacterium]|nr:endonuclease/exonuclease/phosphatase family protein [Verrucomicrobiota bacterium]
MTYNIRFASNSKPNAWPDRLPPMAELIKKNNPDIIGTQEGKFYQLKELSSKIPEYTWLGTGRDGGSRGEFMAIFYKPDRFEVLEFDDFWLSDTPNVIASTSWGNELPRMVTWVRFLDRESKKEFYFWNTHFDHQSQNARENSSELIAKKVKALKTKLPVILVGDFNATAFHNKAYKTLIGGGFEDTLLTAKKALNTGWNTFNGFRQNKRGNNRIDWVLATKGTVGVSEAEIVLYDNTKQYPSDHLPVTAVITLE